MFENHIQDYNVNLIDDSNRFFEFNVGIEFGRLEKSIRRFGILHPIWILNEGEKDIILSGFKRFDIAKMIGLETVPVRCLKMKIPAKEAFLLVLEEQWSHRDLNVIEIAKALVILKRLGYRINEIPQEYLEILNLPVNQKLLSRYIECLNYPMKVQNYISKYNLSLKQTEIFNDFSDEELGLIILLVDKLNLKSHELNEISTQIRDMARRKKMTIENVWDDLNIDKTLDDHEKNRNEKIKLIKDQLTDVTFPILSEANERINRHLSNLNTQTNGKWSWDQTFERPGLVYHLEIVKTKDIESIVNDFTDKQNREILSKILKEI